MLAGADVGWGIALIFAIGTLLAAVQSPFLMTLTGASFGLALTLVILAGSDRCTGSNLTRTIGWLTRRQAARDRGRGWV